MSLNWLEIAKKLKAISQAGKNYSENEFQLERFCDIENIAAEICENYTQLSQDQLKLMFQEDCGYPTPKADCRGVVFKDDKILLVKEIEDGGWTLPGGWCDNGLTPAENVEREIWEESGYRTKALRLIAVYDRDTQGHTKPYPFNIYKMFFLCEITGGQAKPSNETSEIKFFSRSQIPQLSTPRTLPHQLEIFFDMKEKDEFPTHFD